MRKESLEALKDICPPIDKNRDRQGHAKYKYDRHSIKHLTPEQVEQAKRRSSFNRNGE
jgi:hypothetical protein